MGCLALGFSGIGRAGFQRPGGHLYFRYYALRVHIFRILNTLLTVLSVCFTKHNFKIFWLPSPEGIRNISLGRAFTDSRARRNRPNRTGLDYVCDFMDVRTTENRARRPFPEHDLSVPMIVR